MNRSLFDFNPPKWLPTQDKAVLEYCRNIKREEMEITNEHGYSIRVVPHPSSAVTIELFNRIWQSDVEDKKTVIIFPNSWRNIYSSAVNMCNKFNVSGRNIHAFCMDEWADEDGNVAPITYGPSLGGHFMREFYLSFREDLRPKLSQMHYYTNENIGHYSDLIDEVGEGGADLIISATGWIGHTAFIDPKTKKFKANSLEEFMDLPAGFVDNHRLTIVQNSGGFGSGDLYHTPRYSVSIGPRDVMHARDHLERHDLGYCGGYSSWERMISRLQLYGPVCMEVPASLYQLTKGTIYVSEDMARPIEPMDLVAF
jgi:6-phosphogluconolactonase/glucosamine-6-phosphate isomerase/deaminase